MSERDLIPPTAFIDSFIKSAVKQGIGVTVIYAFREGTRLVTRLASTADAAASRAMIQMIAKRSDMQVDQHDGCLHPGESPEVCPCPEECLCKTSTCKSGN